MKQGTVEKIIRRSFYTEAIAAKRIQIILEAVLKLVLLKMILTNSHENVLQVAVRISSSLTTYSVEIKKTYTYEKL